MKERLVHLLNSLTAKYVAVFTLLVAVPAIGISAYLLDSSYNDNKAALVREQQQRAKANSRARSTGSSGARPKTWPRSTARALCSGPSRF